MGDLIGYSIQYNNSKRLILEAFTRRAMLVLRPPGWIFV